MPLISFHHCYKGLRLFRVHCFSIRLRPIVQRKWTKRLFNVVFHQWMNIFSLSNLNFYIICFLSLWLTFKMIIWKRRVNFYVEPYTWKPFNLVFFIGPLKSINVTQRPLNHMKQNIPAIVTNLPWYVALVLGCNQF